MPYFLKEVNVGLKTRGKFDEGGEIDLKIQFNF